VLARVSDSRLSFLRARIVLNIGVKLETLSNSGEIGRHIFFGHWRVYWRLVQKVVYSTYS
jgi:hypothetical protein